MLFQPRSTRAGRHLFRLLGATVLSLMLSANAHAQPASPSGPPLPPPAVAQPPSPFQAGMHGFSMGLAAGLAGGYLFARDDGFDKRDWRPLVAGAGIGALGGGALGFTLGLLDNSSSGVGGGMSPGRSYLIMRGMSEGGGFGMVAGGIIGGLAALKTDDPEHILFGAAIGTLAGTGLGLLYGSLQSNPWDTSRHSRYALTFGFQPYRTSGGGLTFGPSVGGRF